MPIPPAPTARRGGRTGWSASRMPARSPCAAAGRTPTAARSSGGSTCTAGETAAAGGSGGAPAVLRRQIERGRKMLRQHRHGGGQPADRQQLVAVLGGAHVT